MTESDLIFNKEYAVHSYETDARGFVKASALLNYLQDSAGEHAGRLGVGVLDLFKRNMTWVLSRYHIAVHRYPARGARLEVTTWPSGKHGYFALRDFEVADGEAAPSSRRRAPGWSSDSTSKQPVKVDEAIAIPYAVDKRALADPFDSLAVPAGRDAEVGFRVESGHIDWNRHVNNAVYVQWALEAVPPDVLQRSRPVDLEVSYRAEAFYGDQVVSVLQRVPGADPGAVFLHQILNAATGAELTRLKTRWE
ncbi:MAG: thioesterase [Candidatus Moduliflexus flocculans]|nr:thioesterase [Candidatus Moduliflexus flocculans]